MDIFKRLAVTVLVLFCISLLFRGWTYRHMVTYESLGERRTFQANSPKLTEFVSINTDSDLADAESIVKESLLLTSKNLKFTNGKHDVDPNILIETKKANCIGYASFMATICNMLLERNNLSNEWIATPQIGQLYFLGRNIHLYFTSAFFKDHDFVILKNLKTGEEFGIDPSLHDYALIERITLKK